MGIHPIFHPNLKKTFCKESISLLGFCCSHHKAQIKIALCCIGEKLYLQMTQIMEQLSTLQI